MSRQILAAAVMVADVRGVHHLQRMELVVRMSWIRQYVLLSNWTVHLRANPPFTVNMLAVYARHLRLQVPEVRCPIRLTMAVPHTMERKKNLRVERLVSFCKGNIRRASAYRQPVPMDPARSQQTVVGNQTKHPALIHLVRILRYLII